MIHYLDEIKAEKLEDNYNLMIQYYKQMQKGQISAEEYNKKKILILEDMTYDFQHNRYKNSRLVNYKNCAYFFLTMLYEVIKAITQEDYEHYSEYI